MSGPVARLVAQVVLMSVNIASKAFMAAYTQAKSGASSAAASGARAATVGRMPLDQARQVLNLESRAPLSREEVMRAFTKHYEANDPDKGGSFYIQSKVWNAKETCLEEVKRQAAAAAASAAASAAAAADKPRDPSHTDVRKQGL